MEVTPEQVFLVGLVASGLAAIIRLLAAKAGFTLSKAWMSVLAAAVSVILAVLFNLPQLPEYIDPLQYLGEWISLASAYLGMATAIYNLVIDKLLEATNLTVERFLKSR